MQTLGDSKPHLQKGDTEGDLRYKVVYPKLSKEWVAKPVKEKKTQDHLRPMLDAIIERKNQDPNERSDTLTALHIPRNIAATPTPR